MSAALQGVTDRTGARRERAPACMVIGYGNPLRGDDALGPLVAAAVETWNLPHVSIIITHQLVPELAAQLAQAEQVIFIDASIQLSDDQFAHLEQIVPQPHNAALGHGSNPSDLLALATWLYDAAPAAWCLHLHATAFEVGAPLSSIAQQALAEALALLRTLLAGSEETMSQRAKQ